MTRSLCVFEILAVVCSALLSVTGEFIGWNGETYDPVKIWGKDAVFHQQHNVVIEDDLPISSNRPDDGVIDRHEQKRAETIKEIQSLQDNVQKESDASQSSERWIEQLSWTPRAFLFHSFLTTEECDHVIQLARPLVKRSTVVGGKGNDVVDNIRTSYGTFLPRMVDDVIRRIGEKVANWTHFPMSHQEDMNVLRYSYQQKYGTHLDLLHEENKRFATVLMYLSDVAEGGETAFPLSNKWIDPAKAEQPFSECAKGHIAVHPKKGDALLFFSLMPDGGVDEVSLHTGCPVLQGIKWTATIWIRGQPFREELLEKGALLMMTDPGICVDSERDCPEWAADGDCEKDVVAMRRRCRLSCQACTPCSADDYECYTKNRLDADYPRLEDVY